MVDSCANLFKAAEIACLIEVVVLDLPIQCLQRTERILGV